MENLYELLIFVGLEKVCLTLLFSCSLFPESFSALLKGHPVLHWVV